MRRTEIADGQPAVFFDVMDTLVHNPFYQEIPAFFGMSLDELLRVKHPTSWVEFERGEIPEAEYLRRMFADERPYAAEAFLASVKGAYRWIDGMESLVAELRERGIEMHTLSNYPVWYRVIEEKLRLSRYLRWTFVSCLAGVQKPRPEAYTAAAGAVKRPPGACLLIDDSRENCAGAERAGMPAIWFRSAADLRREFVRRGLL
jgi:FMN hydrolase / 5-amino-6-(5-phospho-D-ribitylamino)uracil phosphatase